MLPPLKGLFVCLFFSACTCASAGSVLGIPVARTPGAKIEVSASWIVFAARADKVLFELSRFTCAIPSYVGQT